MTPSQFRAVADRIDELVEELTMQEACHKYEVLEAMKSYLDRDCVDRAYCEELGHAFNASGRCIRCSERKTEGTNDRGDSQ